MSFTFLIINAFIFLTQLSLAESATHLNFSPKQDNDRDHIHTPWGLTVSFLAVQQLLYKSRANPEPSWSNVVGRMVEVTPQKAFLFYGTEENGQMSSAVSAHDLSNLAHTTIWKVVQPPISFSFNSTPAQQIIPKHFARARSPFPIAYKIQKSNPISVAVSGVGGVSVGFSSHSRLFVLQNEVPAVRTSYDAQNFQVPSSREYRQTRWPGVTDDSICILGFALGSL